MVAVRHWEADKFLAKLPEHVTAYLFYGTDPGLVHERLTKVIRSFITDPSDAFQLVRIEGDEIASDVGRLGDEINTIGLFGGRRAIWVKVGSRNIIPALEAALDSNAKDTLLVLEAAALKKDSAIRKLFERERSAVAVECVHDTPEQLRQLIEDEARNQGLAIDRETARTLAHSLGADRLTTRSELSKLLLYVHGEKSITEKHVEAIVTDASDLNLEAVISAAFGGDLDRLDETIQHALNTGTDSGMLLGMASRHAVMLHRARVDVDNGVSRDSAIERAARRAFIFTKKEILASQLERWSSDKLVQGIVVLGRALHEGRKNAQLAESLMSRAFLSIASAARRGSAR